MQDALSNILRRLSQLGLFNQTGYRLFIETLATKIFDERRNEVHKTQTLNFYISDDEANFQKLSDPKAQAFIGRISKTHGEAREQYKRILKAQTLNWKDESHVRAVVAIAQAFQDYSFQRSSESDLYQIVFYNFANEFSRAESAQFLTPLPVIRFLVSVVNRATAKPCSIRAAASVIFCRFPLSMRATKPTAGDWTMPTSTAWTTTAT